MPVNSRLVKDLNAHHHLKKLQATDRTWSAAEAGNCGGQKHPVLQEAAGHHHLVHCNNKFVSNLGKGVVKPTKQRTRPPPPPGNEGQDRGSEPMSNLCALPNQDRHQERLPKEALPKLSSTKDSGNIFRIPAGLVSKEIVCEGGGLVWSKVNPVL